MKGSWMESKAAKAVWAVFGVLSLSLIAAAAVCAQDASGAPARAVRLSNVDGHVQVVQGDQVIADPAIVNTPLFEGTQIVTMDDGKAEIQFEDGSVARLSPNSSLTLAVLKPDDGTEMSVDSGLAYFELQSGATSGRMTVKFGDAAVTASGFTVLRVSLDNPPGELAVFSGNAHLERGSTLALDVHGGESVALSAQGQGQYNLAETIEPDSWDAWNSDRDQALNAEASSRTAATGSFANSSNPGWSDLDANGNWYDVPGQGYVWSPYDAANSGWDPYGNGYWMYTPRFGYMWVSGDSWGYLPFSCGMWNFYGGFGWGWAPGVGGCNPWWGGGIYAVNIGYAPFGYLPPHIPRRPPVHHPVTPGHRFAPIPVIAVNKRPAGGYGGVTPRNRNVSATIAGHVVMPLKPLSPRPVYDHTPGLYGGRTVAGANGGAAHGYAPNGTRAPGMPVNGNVVTPRPVTPVRMPGPRPMAPAPAPRSAPPPAAHAASAPAPASHGGGGSPHH